MPMNHIIDICFGNSMTCTWYLAIIPRVIFQSFPKFYEPRSGEWYLENFQILQDGIIAKYHVQVMLLFVYNRSREFFGNAQETFLYGSKNKRRRRHS